MLIDCFYVEEHAFLVLRVFFFDLVVIQKLDKLFEAHKSIRCVLVRRNVVDEELVLHAALVLHVEAELLEAIGLGQHLNCLVVVFELGHELPRSLVFRFAEVFESLFIKQREEGAFEKVSKIVNSHA